MSIVASSEEINGKAEAIVEDIQRILQPDHLEAEHELSLIAVVGEGMLCSGDKDGFRTGHCAHCAVLGRGVSFDICQS